MLHPPYFYIAAFILYFGIFIPRTHAESPQWPSFLGAGKSFIEPDSIPVKWGLNRNKAWGTTTSRARAIKSGHL